MVFARETSDALTSLVKKFDAAAAQNSKAKMGTFVIFLNDEEALPKKLKDLASKEGLKKCVLAVDNGNPTGPKGYDIAKEAEVTVVLYNKRKVEANYAFKKGELNAAAIEKIVADIPKILPEAKKSEE